MLFAFVAMSEISSQLGSYRHTFDEALEDAYTTANTLHTTTDGRVWHADNVTVSMLVAAVHKGRADQSPALTQPASTDPLAAVDDGYGHVLLRDLVHPPPPKAVKSMALAIVITGGVLVLLNAILWAVVLAMHSEKYLHPSLCNAAWGRHVFVSVFLVISYALVDTQKDRLYGAATAMAFIAAVSLSEARSCFTDMLRPFTDDYLMDRLEEKADRIKP